MPREIAWLPDAVRHVARLKEFIREKNPVAVQRAASRIKAVSLILKENPEAGKPVEEVFPFRDLFSPFGSGNYVLRYREDDSRVVIVRVRHSREEVF